MKNKVLFSLYFLLSFLYFTSVKAQDIEQSETPTPSVKPTFAQKHRFTNQPALEAVTVTQFNAPYSEIKLLDADNRERTFLISDKTTFNNENNSNQKPALISKESIKEDAVITLVYAIVNNKLTALDITLPKQIEEDVNTATKPEENAHLKGILEAYSDDIAIIGGSKVKLMPTATITCVSKEDCDCKCPGLKKDQKGKMAYVMDSTLVDLAPFVSVSGSVSADGILYAEKMTVYDNIQTDADKQYLSKLQEVVNTKSLVLSPSNDYKKLAIGGSVTVGEATYNVLQDSLIQQYINRVGNRVTPQWTHKMPKSRGAKPSFYVLDNPVPDAFSFGDGKVFITTGLLKMAKNEHQLAFILANEVAHITHKHAIAIANQKAKVKKTSNLAKVGIGVGIGAILVVGAIVAGGKMKKKEKPNTQPKPSTQTNTGNQTQIQKPTNTNDENDSTRITKSPNQTGGNGQVDGNSGINPSDSRKPMRKRDADGEPDQNGQITPTVSPDDVVIGTKSADKVKTMGTTEPLSTNDQNGLTDPVVTPKDVSGRTKSSNKVKTIGAADPINEPNHGGQISPNVTPKDKSGRTKSSDKVQTMSKVEPFGEAEQDGQTTTIDTTIATNQNGGHGQLEPIDKSNPHKNIGVGVSIEIDLSGIGTNGGTDTTIRRSDTIVETDTLRHIDTIVQTDTLRQTGTITTGTVSQTDTLQKTYTPKQTVDLMFSVEDLVNAFKPLYFNSIMPAAKDLQAAKVGLFYMKQAGYDVAEAPKLWDNVLSINEDKNFLQNLISATAKSLDPVFKNIAEEKKMKATEVIKDFTTNLILQTPFVSAYKAKKRIKQIRILVKTQYRDVKSVTNLVDTEGFSYLARVLEQ
jgi:Peptidase family M48